MTGEWPETAKNRGEPLKMIHSSETDIFSGGPNGKVIAPGILVICAVDKNGDYYTKNPLLAPNIQILGSKKHNLVSSGRFEPHRSMFSTQKRFPDVRVPKVLPHPPQKWIFGPKTAKSGPKYLLLVICGQILAFWAKYWHFGPISSSARSNNNVNEQGEADVTPIGCHLTMPGSNVHFNAYH